MRLIGSVEREPFGFVAFLRGRGIEAVCEEGEKGYTIWIEDEDRVKEAEGYLEAFRRDPRAFEKEEPPPPPRRPAPRRRSFASAPYGRVSMGVLVVVIGLFVWGLLEGGPRLPEKLPGVVQAPVLPRIDRVLLYDFPAYFQKRDELLKVYPEGGQALLRELQEMPVWMGMYDRVVARLKGGDPGPTGPLFEKIREGEVWRVFTPALLHFNLLHIFFNVLWFVMLTHQIEFRVGVGRYLLFLGAVGILSNSAQYVMSGPYFMGLSGIVCGMAGFIWARQQVAPWEGYLLHRLTLLFLGIFVVGMFLLQVAFFFVQIFSKGQLSIGIANTAHIVGGVVGYLLGRMRLFAIKK